jgi:hypothetical protein
MRDVPLNLPALHNCIGLQAVGLNSPASTLTVTNNKFCAGSAWGSRGLSSNPRITLAEIGIDKNLAHQARKFAALPEAKFEALVGRRFSTYRDETLCMSGKAGELAKWTVSEHDDPGKHGRSTLQLVPWKAFPARAVASRKPGIPAPEDA